MASTVAEPLPQGKRARIIRAARDVCGRRGFDAARMEEIATEAGVSKGTLYRFFSSKEDLLLATLLDTYEQAERAAAARTARPGMGPLEERLEGYLIALPVVASQMNANLQAWGVVARNPALQRTLYSSLRARYEARAEDLARSLREGIRAQRYRDDVDVEQFVGTLLAVVDGVVYRSVFDPERASAATLRAGFANLLDSIRLRSGQSPSGAPGREKIPQGRPGV